MKKGDYRITDSIPDPGGAETLYTEKLVRLDPCAWCYRPPAEAPEVNELPAKANGFITFGSFNALAKVSDRTIENWASILKLSVGSRLVLKAAALAEPAAR